MTETSDPQLQLKKRARRRLVGAVAFAGLAAVVLPMVMDEEPKQSVQDVPIRIPGQDQSPSSPRTGGAGDPQPLPPSRRPAVKPRRQIASGVAAEAGRPAPLRRRQPPETEKAARKLPCRPRRKPKSRRRKSPSRPKRCRRRTVTRKSSKRSRESRPKKAVEKKVVKPAEKVPEKPVDKKSKKNQALKRRDKPARQAAGQEGRQARRDDDREEAGKPPGDDGAGASRQTAGSRAGQIRRPAGDSDRRFCQSRKCQAVAEQDQRAGVSNYTESSTRRTAEDARARRPFPKSRSGEKALEKLKKIGVSGVVAGRQ
jgi:DedD protein